MKEWFISNWLPLLVFVIAIAVMVFTILKKKGLKQAAIDAIVLAEKNSQTEEGKEKMQKAIDYMQQVVPFLNYLPDSLIEAFIQSVFDQIKKALDYQAEDKK